MSIPQKSVEAFHRDGFTSIDALVGAADVERIRSILMRLHEANVGFKQGALFDAAGLDDGDPTVQRFPQLDGPHHYAKELLQTEYFQKAFAIARQTLGEKARFKGDISFLKPARIGSITPWHQDVAFTNPAFACNEFSIWLAVTPASAENSCLAFIPNSHHMGVLTHRPMDGDPRNYALECVGDFDASNKVECPLQPGGCVMHTCYTLHCAGPNLSDTPRLAYVLEFEVPPVLRDKPLDYPWRKERENTSRAKRARAWRMRGGFFIGVWRQRHLITIERLLFEFRKRMLSQKT